MGKQGTMRTTSRGTRKTRGPKTWIPKKVMRTNLKSIANKEKAINLMLDSGMLSTFDTKEIPLLVHDIKIKRDIASARKYFNLKQQQRIKEIKKMELDRIREREMRNSIPTYMTYNPDDFMIDVADENNQDGVWQDDNFGELDLNENQEEGEGIKTKKRKFRGKKSKKNRY